MADIPDRCTYQDEHGEQCWNSPSSYWEWWQQDRIYARCTIHPMQYGLTPISRDEIEVRRVMES